MMIRERDYLSDNIRAFLIFLVVLGRFMQISLRDEFMAYKAIWLAIYTVHIPMLMFIAGFFTGKDNNSRYRGVVKLGVLYLIMNLIVVIAKRTAVTTVTLSYPEYATWFLLVLLVFRYLSPLYDKKYALPVSVIISICAGMIPTTQAFLSWGRIASLMPFYVLGYRAKSEFKSMKDMQLLLRKKRWIVLAVSMVLVIGFVYISAAKNLSLNVVWNKTSYSLSDMTWPAGAAMRAFFLLASLGSGAICLLIFPTRHTHYSYIGENSLSVYMLHVAVYYVISHYNLIPGSCLKGGIILLFLASLTTIILAIPYFRTILEFPFSVVDR